MLGDQSVIRFGDIYAGPTGRRFQILSVDPIVATIVGRHRVDCGVIRETPVRLTPEVVEAMAVWHSEPWTRQQIEARHHLDRPMVRVQWPGGEGMGDLGPDGSQCWVTASASRVKLSRAFGWHVILRSLNDPRAWPLELKAAPKLKALDASAWRPFGEWRP
jgi:hypothetical protein